MFPLNDFGQVASGPQFELVLQIFYLPDLFYQNDLALDLIEVIDDILLGTDEAVCRELQLPAEFEQEYGAA